MTRKECDAIAEIALTGFIARHFVVGREYGSPEFRKALKMCMEYSVHFRKHFRGLGVFLASLTLFENDRRAFSSRLTEMDLERAIIDVLKNAQGLFGYPMFPSFEAASQEEDDRLRKRRELRAER